MQEIQRNHMAHIQEKTAVQYRTYQVNNLNELL